MNDRMVANELKKIAKDIKSFNSSKIDKYYMDGGEDNDSDGTFYISYDIEDENLMDISKICELIMKEAELDMTKVKKFRNAKIEEVTNGMIVNEPPLRTSEAKGLVYSFSAIFGNASNSQEELDEFGEFLDDLGYNNDCTFR